MKGMGFSRINIAAALAALATPLDAKDSLSIGKATLDTMFRPLFDVSGGQMSHGKPGKHRMSGMTSPRGNSQQDWRRAPGHRAAARNLRRGGGPGDSNWLQRKAWLERNAHVIAKREADQQRARDNQGRNTVIWGRR